MIAAGKLPDALAALNAVLVCARTMAFERRPHEVLAKVLDIAELLPTLILREPDMTDQFCGHLDDLVKLDEGFRAARVRFNWPIR